MKRRENCIIKITEGTLSFTRANLIEPLLYQGGRRHEASQGEKWSGDLRKRNSAKARPIIPTVSGGEEEKVKPLGSSQ